MPEVFPSDSNSNSDPWGTLWKKNLWAHEKIPVKLHEFMRIIQDTDMLTLSFFGGFHPKNYRWLSVNDWFWKLLTYIPYQKLLQWKCTTSLQ